MNLREYILNMNDEELSEFLIQNLSQYCNDNIYQTTDGLLYHDFEQALSSQIKIVK